MLCEGQEFRFVKTDLSGLFVFRSAGLMENHLNCLRGSMKPQVVMQNSP